MEININTTGKINIFESSNEVLNGSVLQRKNNKGSKNDNKNKNKIKNKK